MSSPSAPAVSQPFDMKSCPPAVVTSSAVAATTLGSDPMAIRHHISSQSSKLTKAAKKLFVDSDINQRNNSSETDSLSGDLLADAPTGPTFDWTQEQTIAFLNLCKHFSKELAPKRNALEVKPQVWEQLAKDLNSRGIHFFR